METREIGSVTEIDVAELRLVYHRAGNPAQEALMLRELLDRGLKQSDIAKLLEAHQAQISRKLKLLQLTPALFKRVLAGEIKARTGYQLARLPKERQAEFEGAEKVTMKVSEEAVREMVLNKDVIALIRDFETEDTKAPDGRGIRRLVNLVLEASQLADELDIKLGNGAEVGSLLGGIYEDIKNEELK